MDNKEIDKLSAAYNSVSDKQIINELSWFNPYNSVTSAAKRWASGRGGFGSQLASKWMPGSEELHGQSELEDETNEVWKQFRRQILSQDENPKGANILNWFKNKLGIDPKVIPALKDNIVPNERYYDDDVLRSIFEEVLRQARQNTMTGGAYDETSIYKTNHKLVLRAILDMDSDTTCDLIRTLLARDVEGDESDTPHETDRKDLDDLAGEVAPRVAELLKPGETSAESKAAADGVKKEITPIAGEATFNDIKNLPSEDREALTSYLDATPEELEGMERTKVDTLRRIDDKIKNAGLNTDGGGI